MLQIMLYFMGFGSDSVLSCSYEEDLSGHG